MNTIVHMADFLRKKQLECVHQAMELLDKAQKAIDSGDTSLCSQLLQSAEGYSEAARAYKRRASSYTTCVFSTTFLGQPFYHFTMPNK